MTVEFDCSALVFKAEPVFPDTDNSGRHFQKRQIYFDILKEDPGLTNGQIALKLGRPVRCVTPFLLRLRKYCGAVEVREAASSGLLVLKNFFRIQASKRCSRSSAARKLELRG
jgi:hypothetical protein